MADGLDDIAGTSLALRPDEGCTFRDSAQRLAEITAATDERDLEGVLIDVILIIGRCQDLRFINVIWIKVGCVYVTLWICFTDRRQPLGGSGPPQSGLSGLWP